MKKVLKFNAKTQIDDKTNKQYVNLVFQTYKDGKTNFGGRVIIYRREESGYVYDYDEGEYFDCLLPTENDIIFNGELPIDNTFSEYRDYDVEVGKVYAYWVGRESVGKFLTGPIAIKVRDLRVWWHFDTIVEKCYELQNSFNKVTIKNYGSTVLGKPLNAVLVGNQQNVIACVGAIHGGESGPEILLTAVKEILTEKRELLDKCGLAIMPVVNADMREKMTSGTPWYIRANLVGVDLNRNFNANWQIEDKSYNLSSADYRSPTYRGINPESEPETKAVVNFINEVDPKVIFSYHCLSSVSADELLSAKSAKNDTLYMMLSNIIAEIYSDGYREAVNYPLKEDKSIKSFSSSGSLPEFAYAKGIPAFDLEICLDYEDMLNRCRTDTTTVETLEFATRGHKNALIKILEYFSK